MQLLVNIAVCTLFIIVNRPLDNMLKNVEKADSPKEKAKYYRALLELYSPEQILKSDCKISKSMSLQLAWELSKKSPKGIDEFIKGAEKTANVPFPGWWRDLLKKVVFREKKHFIPIRFGGPSTPSPTVKFDKNLLFLADHNMGGAPCCLECQNERTSKVLWQAEVWAVNCLQLGGFANFHFDIEVTSDTVYVFGAESGGLFIEAFQRHDGKCLLRFCTCYWLNYSEEWNMKRGR